MRSSVSGMDPQLLAWLAGLPAEQLLAHAERLLPERRMRMDVMHALGADFQAMGAVHAAEAMFSASRELANSESFPATSAANAHNLGLLALRGGRPTEAVGWFSEAARVEEQGGRLREAAASMELAVEALEGAERWGEAVAYAERASAIFEQIHDALATARSVLRVANVHLKARAHEDALATFRRLLTLDVVANTPRLRASARAGVGISLSRLGRPGEGLPILHTALSEVALDDAHAEVISSIHAWIAEAQALVGESTSSLQHMLISLEMRAANGKPHLYREVKFVLLSDACWDPERARRNVQRALAVSQICGDQAEQARGLLDLAECWMALEDARKARDLASSAVSLARTLGHIDVVADGLLDLARYEIQSIENRHDDAGKAIGEALALVMSEQPEQLASLHLRIAALFLGTEQLGPAEAHYRAAFETAKLHDDMSGVLESTRGLVEIQVRLGDPRELKNRIKLLWQHASGEPAAENLPILITLGHALAYTGENRLAIVSFNLASTLLEMMEDDEIEVPMHEKQDLGRSRVHLLNDTGVCHFINGDWEEAAALYRKAIERNATLRRPLPAGRLHINLGRSLLQLGRLAEARDSIEQGLAMHRVPIDDDRLAWKALRDLALARGDQACALECSERLIAVIEQVLGGLASDRYVRQYSRLIEDDYLEAFGLAVNSGHLEDALRFAELYRARGLALLLSTGDIHPRVPATPEMAAAVIRERELLASLRPVHHSELPSASALHRRPGTGGELDAILSQFEPYDPDYVALRRGRPPSHAELCHLLADVGSCCLLSYMLYEGRVHILVQRSAQQTLQLVTTDLSEAELASAMRDYWREVVDYPWRGETSQTWGRLGLSLVAPLLNLVPPDETVIVVPHGPLHRLPLAALPADGIPWVERNPIVQLPSVSTLASISRKSPSTSEEVAVLGATFEDEARDVAAFFGVEPILGANANEVALLQALAQCALVHVSCHGRFRPEEPMASGLLLGNGAVITASRLAGSQINAELITLSACQTGANVSDHGDELLGLTRAILFAGARSLLVTHWDVDAKAASALSLAFYRYLRGGLDKARALRAAQLEVRASPEWRHPYFWASFALVGAWS